MLKLLIDIVLVVLLVKLVLYLSSRSDAPSLSEEKSEAKADPKPDKPSGFGRTRAAAAAEELVEDAHCGVYVPRSAALTDGSGRHFCSRDCLDAHARGKE